MQSIEQRGRLYLLIFIIILVIADLLIKGLLLAAGTLRWSQAGGTVITLLACWFLWQGSKFAYWFLAVCTALAVVVALFALVGFSASIATVVGIFLAALLFLLLAPATRSYLSSKRAARA